MANETSTMHDSTYQNAVNDGAAHHFMDAFNQIEQHLRAKLNRNAEQTFMSLVDDFYDKFPEYQGRADLRIFASLRNTLVHGTTDHRSPLFVPSPSALQRIQFIRDALLTPEQVLPRFERPVVQVDLKESVSGVLRKVAEHDFSQFPVYDGDRFKGLLTENGITRWIAEHALNSRLQIDLEAAAVQDLMKLEAARGKFRFIRANTSIAEMMSFFSRNPNLEAAFITANGHSVERLAGIVTVYDVLVISSKRGAARA